MVGELTNEPRNTRLSFGAKTLQIGQSLLSNQTLVQVCGRRAFGECTRADCAGVGVNETCCSGGRGFPKDLERQRSFLFGEGER